MIKPIEVDYYAQEQTQAEKNEIFRKKINELVKFVNEMENEKCMILDETKLKELKERLK